MNYSLHSLIPKVPASGAWARGKRVLVLGFGNAALEVTKALEDHAQAVVGREL